MIPVSHFDSARYSGLDIQEPSVRYCSPPNTPVQNHRLGPGTCGSLYPICTKTIGPEFAAGTLVLHLPFSISYSSLIIKIFPHKAVASERSYPRHVDASIRMIRVYLQYNAILHGKELHHE